MSDTEVVQLPSGTLVQDRYLIVRPVGQGGLSTVYQVSDTHEPAAPILALKEQLDLSQSARKQFAREAGWLKALDHPHIPKVTAFFEWHRRLYLVMEFIAGENLEQKLERAGGRPLSEAQVLPWVMPICDALNYMHSRMPPILHRDVKPANIIVTPAGRPVLVDLGIAKEHGPVANKTATFVRKAGTEGYAPPEQYAAAGLSGPWSDVYGFGATIYHLLTAQIPPTAVERVALDVNLIPPSAYNSSVSRSTDVAIMRALAIRPQDRYPSLAPMKQALMGGTASGPLMPAMRSPASGATPTSGHTPMPPLTGGQDTLNGAARSGRQFSSAHLPASAIQISRDVSGPLSGATAAPTGRHAVSQRAAAITRIVQTEVTEEGGARRSEGGRAIFWWASLAAAALIVVAAAAIALHIFAPVDRSTSRVTVTGYFDALEQQDYGRAWQYTAASANDPRSEATFAQSRRADDALGGRVLSIRVVGTQTESGSHESVVVSVVRSGSPGNDVTQTVLVSQYGGNWLIDSITTG